MKHTVRRNNATNTVCPGLRNAPPPRAPTRAQLGPEMVKMDVIKGEEAKHVASGGGAL